MIEIVKAGKIPEKTFVKYECHCNNCETVFRMDEGDWPIHIMSVDCPLCKQPVAKTHVNVTVILVNEKGEKVKPAIKEIKLFGNTNSYE